MSMPRPVIAELSVPGVREHDHDVSVLSSWMSQLDTDAHAMRRQAEELLGEDMIGVLITKARQYSVFHDELARQTAVHCPTVAKLLVKVWSAMCQVTDVALQVARREYHDSEALRARLKEVTSVVMPQMRAMATENDDLRTESAELREANNIMIAKHSAMQKQAAASDEMTSIARNRLVGLLTVIGAEPELSSMGPDVPLSVNNMLEAPATEIVQQVLDDLDGLDHERKRQAELTTALESLVKSYRIMLFKTAFSNAVSKPRDAHTDAPTSLHGEDAQHAQSESDTTASLRVNPPGQRASAHEGDASEATAWMPESPIAAILAAAAVATSASRSSLPTQRTIPRQSSTSSVGSGGDAVAPVSPRATKQQQQQQQRVSGGAGRSSGASVTPTPTAASPMLTSSEARGDSAMRLSSTGGGGLSVESAGASPPPPPPRRDTPPILALAAAAATAAATATATAAATDPPSPTT